MARRWENMPALSSYALTGVALGLGLGLAVGATVGTGAGILSAIVGGGVLAVVFMLLSGETVD
ncbi:MAG: hypothetical protein MI723_16170 [Caulobacterales bacterium]|nr:hypothetical protein [Caulobacterales bacterium]